MFKFVEVFLGIVILALDLQGPSKYPSRLKLKVSACLLRCCLGYQLLIDCNCALNVFVIIEGTMIMRL